MNDERILGFDVGGTKCAVVIGDRAGNIHGRSWFPTRVERGPDAIVGELIETGRRLQRDLRSTFGVAGVSIGGPLDAQTGVVLAPPNLPGWDRVPLGRMLVDAFGVPVSVEHDGSACARAEFLWGAGRGAGRLAYLTCGTGFGLGLVFDGSIYRGADGRYSDIGHVRYRDDGPLAYGRRGSLEGFASSGALGRLAAWRYPERWKETPPDGQTLSALARAGDAGASEILRINAQAVGDACASLADTLLLDRILLGSAAIHLGPAWVHAVRARFLAEALATTTEVCTVEPSGLGKRLQDCSTLAAAIGDTSGI